MCIQFLIRGFCFFLQRRAHIFASVRKGVFWLYLLMIIKSRSWQMIMAVSCCKNLPSFLVIHLDVLQNPSERSVTIYLVSICFAAETFHLNACPLSQLSVETVPFPYEGTMGSYTAVSTLSCQDLYCLRRNS